jgi:hypothetical protein
MSAKHNNDWQEENRPPGAGNSAASKRVRIKKWRGAPGKAKVQSEKIDLDKVPMMLDGAAIAAGLIGIILFYNETISDTKNTQATRADIKVEEWQGLLPLQVAERYIDATTNEERLRWVRDPEENAPLLEDFYQNGAGAKEKITELKQMEPVSTEKFLIHRYQVRLADGANRLLCVVQIDNRACVDFKAYARHCSSKWQDLLSGSASAAAEVRVFLDAGNAYMHQYADEAQWTCYTATTQDWEMPLFFFAEHGSKTDEALRDLTRGRSQRVTLAIRSKDNSHEKKQFEIVELLAAGWCY